jgi:GTP1/Obg family GTP-binding protein
MELDEDSKSADENLSDGSSSPSVGKENSVYQKSNFAILEPIASSTRLIDKFINRLKGNKILRNASPNNTSPSASFEERRMKGSNDPSQSINDENHKDFEELQNHLTILMETYKNVCQERDQLKRTLNQGNKKNNSDRIRSKFHTNSAKQPTILIL